MAKRGPQCAIVNEKIPLIPHPRISIEAAEDSERGPIRRNQNALRLPSLQTNSHADANTDKRPCQLQAEPSSMS